MRIQGVFKELRTRGGAIGKPTINVKIGVKGTETKPEEVLQLIKQQKSCTRIAFTGKDPLIDQLDILCVIAELHSTWEIIVETTGGVMPDLNIRDKITSWEINLPEENELLPFKFNNDALLFFNTQKNAFFEFEVKGEQDLIRVKKEVFKNNIPWKRVILAPSTEYIENFNELDRQLNGLVEFCMDKGCNIGNVIIKNVIGGKENGDDNGDSEILGEESSGRD